MRKLGIYLTSLLFALSYSRPTTFAQSTPVHSSGTALVKLALTKMGGEATLRSLKTLRLEWRGYRNLIEQSERPEGPWIPEFSHSTELWDLAELRFSSDLEAEITNDFAFKLRQVVANRVAAQQSGTAWRAGNMGQIQDAEEWMELSPFRVLLNALAATDLRWERRVNMQSQSHDVVSFSWRNRTVRLFINRNTNLPTATELTSTYPYDVFWNVWGDVTTRVYWSFWELGPGGLEYPRQLDVERNGIPYRSLVIGGITFNPKFADDAFAISQGVVSGFEKSGTRRIDDLPIAAAGRTATTPAPGIVHLPSSFDTTIVRQEDGLIIIEGPVSSAYSKRVIEEAGRRFPNERIKAVISTSDAWPHFGGLREYVARGVPIYALDLNVPIIMRLIDASRSLDPDQLQKHHLKPSIRVVSGKTIVGAGDNRLEIYPFRTETGERMMMVYFPHYRLLYASDLIQPAGNGLLNAQYAYETVQAVRREGLQVETVFAMHADPMPWSRVADSTCQASSSGCK